MVATSNAGQVASELLAVGVKAGARAFAVVTHFTQLQTTAIQRHANLPRTAPRGKNTGGPRNMTGDYLGSWHPHVEVRFGTIVGISATDKPQGPRLEWGFKGTDSLGREYDAPPYPHASLGHKEVAPLFEAAMAAIVADVT